MNSEHLIDSQALKAEALRLGFSAVGLCPAEAVDPHVRQAYEDWLARGHQAGMHYLENYPDLRFNPTLLVPGARTIISLALCYHPGNRPTQPALAWYAQGHDYHDVMRRLLTQLLKSFDLTGRAFCDSAPVLDRYWAWHGGLGFIGRHTQLVIPRLGSAFFLGELIVEQEADRHDTPLTPTYFDNLCGQCRRCLDACPTGAIGGCRPIVAERCLSYQTIEHRGPLAPGIGRHLSPCFYGCDRCTRACPHLHAPSRPILPDFAPSDALLKMKAEHWNTLTQEQYQALFRGSAVKRAKYEGLMRNIRAARENNETAE